MGLGILEAPIFDTLAGRLPAIREALREQGLDGWLLYDLHARNPIAVSLLGIGDLSRRYFVYLPAEGEPVAVTHGIEAMPWTNWRWGREEYVAWRRLEEVLRQVLAGTTRVAMEAVERDAVPAVDYVPWGVVELVRGCGPEVVTSAELITRFYASWSAEQLASHRRAARVLQDTARRAFDEIARRVREDGVAREGDMRDWVIAELERQGAGVGADCMVARGPNAANPHYGLEGRGAELRRGDVVLIDLWSKEAEDMVYADQTWMGVLAPEPDERVRGLWEAIRDARDAGVAFLRERWNEGRPVQGYEVDDVVRGVVRERGLADRFIHRTGHSIDRDTHGAGPNIDNLETHEVRLLVPGVGFSIEPGVYLKDDVGLRTEVDVYMGEDGPEVTTPDPQRDVFGLLED